ncbi:MAG: hypothetical protein A2X22_10080 [Bacteroidetes bacterium GWF2_49_14]|nr:MAG: hypothetical protein A2X22_10080 [Bacteroidetes bacterium GWF2_49_14]HBB92054.1 hypothetical protein [Bacteroidales bacterium]
MRKLLLFVGGLLFATIVIGQNATKPQLAYPFSDVILQSTEKATPHLKGISLTGEFTGTTIQDGGDRLVEKQYTDGAWGWDLNAPPTYGNIHGPITKGLAQAYIYTADPDHFNALKKAAAYLLTKTYNFSPSDGYLAKALDEVFGGTTYRNHLNTKFYGPLEMGTYNKGGLGTLYNTASYVNLIRIYRSGGQANLAAWDIGMGLVGAASCGASTTDWIAGVKAEINELDGSKWYDVIGLAGAIYGLAFIHEDFDPTAGIHAGACNIYDLANILASYQIDNGGFSWNSAWVIPNDSDESIQETSYAILALNEVNRMGFLKEILGAADYIAKVQKTTGGWSNDAYYNVENNEITGEALWGYTVAYYAKIPICHKGKTVFVSINAVQAHLAHGDYLGACRKSGSNDSDNKLITESDFKVYPNPSHGIVNVEFTIEEETTATITLVDMTGKTIQSVFNNSVEAGEDYRVEIDTHNLTNGIYMVKMITDAGFSKIIKLIIN